MSGLNQHLPEDIPEIDDATCCAGAAMFGATGCTCWVKVHDLDQAEPLIGMPQVNPDGMCGDCAYRPGSPEKTGDPEVVGTADALEDLAATGTPFWCHQGMRRIVAFRHPAGVDFVPDERDTPAAYDPPIVSGMPFRADGQFGLLCAGWAARGRALAARDQLVAMHLLSRRAAGDELDPCPGCTSPLCPDCRPGSHR